MPNDGSAADMKAAAVELDLDGDRSALMAAAKGRTTGAQVAVLEGMARSGRVASTPTKRLFRVE
jgi:hypothetical protein